MKKSNIIVVSVLSLSIGLALFVYFVARKNDFEVSSEITIEKAEEKPIGGDLPPIPVSSEPHPSDETGWSAFRKINSDPEPEPDVISEIGVSRSAFEPKTISANAGQRVKITFTSALNDQVAIDSYTANTYIMPLGEFSMTFNVDKKGKFAINLVSTKRTIGYLEVN